MFREEDKDNLELVRQIVLYRLKSDPEWHSLTSSWSENYGGLFVDFEHPNLRARFAFLANEVMWQLLTQGVISVGHNVNNLELPYFHVTDYGRKVLDEERFIAHDPTGYLEDMKALSGIILGDTAIAYLEKALRCFNAGCHLAAVLLLGVAAESVFLGLCGVLLDALDNNSEKAKFAKLAHTKPKHRWIIGKYQRLDHRVKRELPESLDVTLISLCELIRRQRNDLGHPQQDPPELTREEAFMFFRLFPGFVRDLEALAQYYRTRSL